MVERGRACLRARGRVSPLAPGLSAAVNASGFAILFFFFLLWSSQRDGWPPPRTPAAPLTSLSPRLPLQERHAERTAVWEVEKGKVAHRQSIVFAPTPPPGLNRAWQEAKGISVVEWGGGRGECGRERCATPPAARTCLAPGGRPRRGPGRVPPMRPRASAPYAAAAAAYGNGGPSDGLPSLASPPRCLHHPVRAGCYHQSCAMRHRRCGPAPRRGSGRRLLDRGALRCPPPPF